MTGILHDHKLILPGNISMLIKCLIELEGTAMLLSPDFSLAEVLEPWRRKFIHKQFSPRARLREIRRLYADWERAAEVIPKAITDVIDKVEKGKFIINVDHQHLKSAVNRVVVGLFLSSFLLASSLLLVHHVPPLIRGVSLLGLAGYLASLAFGFRMIWHNRDSKVSRRKGSWE
jgi:ubiquinone biosynthesis protein